VDRPFLAQRPIPTTATGGVQTRWAALGARTVDDESQRLRSEEIERVIQHFGEPCTSLDAVENEDCWAGCIRVERTGNAADIVSIAQNE